MHRKRCILWKSVLPPAPALRGPASVGPPHAGRATSRRRGRPRPPSAPGPPSAARALPAGAGCCFRRAARVPPLPPRCGGGEKAFPPGPPLRGGCRRPRRPRSALRSLPLLLLMIAVCGSAPTRARKKGVGPLSLPLQGMLLRGAPPRPLRRPLPPPQPHGAAYGCGAARGRVLDGPTRTRLRASAAPLTRPRRAGVPICQGIRAREGGKPPKPCKPILPPPLGRVKGKPPACGGGCGPCRVGEGSERVTSR